MVKDIFIEMRCIFLVFFIYGYSFGNSEFEVMLRYFRDKVEEFVGYVSMEFKSKIWGGDINLSYLCIGSKRSYENEWNLF